MNSLPSPFALCRSLRFVAILLLLLPGSVLPSPAAAAVQSDAISGSTWESPQFGVTINWSGDWKPQESSPTFSDEETQVDSVSLTGAHGNFRGTVLAMLNDTNESHRDYLISVAEALPDYDLIESGENADTAYFAFTAIDETQNDRQFTSIVEVFTLDDDVLAVSEATGWSDILPDLFTDVQEDIEFDDDTPFGYYYTRDTLPVAADDPSSAGDEDSLPGLVDDTSYEGPVSGAEVDWSGDWSVNVENSFSDSGSDVLWLPSPSSELVIMFVTYDDSPARYLDDRLEQFRDDDLFEDHEVIEQDSDDELAWLAATAIQDDTLAIRLYEASWYDENEQILQVVEFTAWANDLETTFKDAQDKVEIENDEPFAYFPSEAVIDAIGFELVNVENEDADAESREPATNDKEDGARGEEDGTDGEDMADLPGIVATGEYESPQYSYSVTWSEDWTPASGFTYSNIHARQDCLRLENGDAFVQITATDIGSESLQSFLSRLIGFRANASGTEVLDHIEQHEVDGRLYLTYHWESSDGESSDIYLEMWAMKENPTIAMQVEIFSPPDDMGEVFASVMDDIELDGEPIFEGTPDE